MQQTILEQLVDRETFTKYLKRKNHYEMIDPFVYSLTRQIEDIHLQDSISEVGATIDDPDEIYEIISASLRLLPDDLKGLTMEEIMYGKGYYFLNSEVVKAQLGLNRPIPINKSVLDKYIEKVKPVQAFCIAANEVLNQNYIRFKRWKILKLGKDPRETLYDEYSDFLETRRTTLETWGLDFEGIKENMERKLEHHMPRDIRDSIYEKFNELTKRLQGGLPTDFSKLLRLLRRETPLPATEKKAEVREEAEIIHLDDFRPINRK